MAKTTALIIDSKTNMINPSELKVCVTADLINWNSILVPGFLHPTVLAFVVSPALNLKHFQQPWVSYLPSENQYMPQMMHNFFKQTMIINFRFKKVSLSHLWGIPGLLLLVSLWGFRNFPCCSFISCSLLSF